MIEAAVWGLCKGSGINPYQAQIDMVGAGVQIVVLLSTADDGAPAYDHAIAAAMAELGVSSFAFTPDLFPDLMAATVNRSDLAQWAASADIPIEEPFRPIWPTALSDGAGQCPAAVEIPNTIYIDQPIGYNVKQHRAEGNSPSHRC